MHAPLHLKPAILVVDDDEAVLHALSEQLAHEGYVVVAISRAAEAIAQLHKTPFSVIITDQRMPDMSGLEFLAAAKEVQPNASRILITGVALLDTAIDAINLGDIARFLTKPWLRAELVATVCNAVHRYELLERNQRLQAETLELNARLAAANADLEAKVAELESQGAALSQAHASLKTNFEHSLELCYRIINTFYPLLGSQTRAVVDVCKQMAETDYFSAEEKRVLVVSAWLHDIGLIGIKRELVHTMHSCSERLSESDRALIRCHPIYGQTLAAFVEKLTAVGSTIRAHHERFDGKGYPDGLAGETIPWTARCLAVAVYFFECGRQREAAMEAILLRSGTYFDPEAVRLFLKVTQSASLPRKVREIMLDELRPGMCLASGIYSPTGMLLIAEGQSLSETMISKIRNHNLSASVTQRLLVFS